FPYLNRPPNSIDFAQMACEPASPHMRLYHPRLPWYIDLMSATPGFGVGYGVIGLTVWEVIEGVWRELQKQITSRDFYNEEMGTLDFGHFGEGEAREMSKGVRRVDWLGMEEEWVWTGIVRKSSGMWEIKTRK
ncbi:hypothetical protein GG344DRAFT_17434, partial [Lentinula edodes]